MANGRSGDYGHIALQLAKYCRAEGFATRTGGDRQLGSIEEVGAKGINYKGKRVYDYIAKHTGRTGFDIVFDSFGEANVFKSFEAARLNGQVAMTISLLEMI